MSSEEAIQAYLENRITRREFIKRLQAVGVTAGAAFGFAELLAGCRSNAGGKPAADQAPSTLGAFEFALLQAISGRLLPTTDTPGAIEAGAALYIDKALEGPYRPQLPRYQAGLAALEKHCTLNLGKSFMALGAEEQDKILESLEAGKIAAVDDGPQFFEMLVRHTMEGVFCEPYYGGNRDLVGWKLVGFPGQRYGYDDPYINRVVDLPPVATDRPPRTGA